ncbi:MAG TPA: phytoene/squalene synthase family protein [Actinospica sp.]|nr:phytoene/squalene synthase family protein [Actinospica sp.]
MTKRADLDPELAAAFARCKAIHRRYDPSFYAGCLMLPPAKRPYIDSLYAHARLLDQIVDDPGITDVAARSARLDERVAAYELALKVGDSPDPILKAAAHTALTWDIPIEHFHAFSDTMRSDLTVTEYATYDDLLAYMYGAAALLGLQLIPILGPLDPSAAERSIAVGHALQLTNILRDIDEDLGRGRLYLPLEDLDKFGVTRADFEARTMTDAIREVLRFESARAREYFADAHSALTLLHPSSRECVGTALTLYAGILDSLEAADYQVFGVRHGFGKLKALRIAAPAYVRARRAWRA